MWARFLSKPGAGPGAYRRVAVTTVSVATAVLALAWGGSATPTHAQSGRDVGNLDVVNERGDTIRVAEEIIISDEGIRIDQGGSSRRLRVEDDDGDRIQIEIDAGGHDLVDIDASGRGEIVGLFRDVDIPKDQVVRGEVVAIFGDIRVEGDVEGDVVAVFGSIRLADSATVSGDAVAIGGIDQSPSSRIYGDSVSIPILGFPSMSPFSMWASFLALLIVLSGMAVLVSVLFPERLRRIAAEASDRTLLSLVVGAASFPLTLITACLLMLTIIGAPVALVLGLLFPVAQFVGYVAGTALLGARIRGRSLDEQPVWLSAVLGIVFVGLFFLAGGMMISLSSGAGVVRAIGFGVMTVGLLLYTVTSLLGLGALLTSKLGQPPRQPNAPATGQPESPTAGSGVPAPSSPTS